VAGRTDAEGWQLKFKHYLKGGSARNEQNGGVEYRGFCPMHEDPETSKSPSASYNFDRNLFHCQPCGKGMPIGSLYHMFKDEIEARSGGRGNVRDISTAPSAQGKKTDPPTEADVKRFRRNLEVNRSMRRKLTEVRGLTEDTIDEYEIGWNKGRYTLPVYDAAGDLVNIRSYRMGASENKMTNWPGYGKMRLYGVDAFEDEADILLCEGEMDMLLARQYGFNSMTPTAGAGSWEGAWSPLFKDRRVFIAFDNDKAGRDGAHKVAVFLLKAGAEVYVLKLPVAERQDLTDFFIAQGQSADNLEDLMAAATLFEPAGLQPRRERPPAVEVTLLETQAAELVDKPIHFIATVAGKQASPYAFPRRTVATCDMNWSDAKCKDCAMQNAHGGQALFNTSSDDKLLLRMVGKTEAERRREFLVAQESQPNCPRVQLDVEEHWSVEQLVVVPSVDSREDGAANVRREVFNVGSHKTPVNATVRFEGLNTDDPRSGVMVMQTWDCKETRTSLDTFEMTPEIMKALSVFQQQEGETVSARLTAIAQDLAANVTHIYGRDLMHIAYDLVWHSLLNFRFRGAQIGKGWLELLVVGDTRTGKSEAAQRLTNHYQNGILTSCEGATLAGLVGGAQQVNNNWVITWGTIPLHDRRLVVLDEVSGLKDKGILEQMSEVRSSGRAKITKIVSQETSARTRLIWISNPVDGRAIAEMPQKALNAITDLIGQPEDIARFDMAMVAAKNDVKSSVINAAVPMKVPHVYTSDLCAQLVLWAWSRGPDAVVWERAAQRMILEWADAIGNEYVPDPPLLQAENARVKLARIAVAMAARLFSHDGTGEKVFVKKEHVYAARDFLRGIYEMPNMGYAQYSRKKLRDAEAAEAGKRWLWSYMRRDKRVFEVLQNVIMRKEFKVRDFEEFGKMMAVEAKEVANDLMERRMVTMHSRGYMRPTPQLVEVVTRMEDREDKRRH
jgi:hypothetical protein